MSAAGNPRSLTVKTTENIAQAAVQEKYSCPYNGGTEWFMVQDDAENKQDFYNRIDTDLWGKLGRLGSMII